MPEWEIELSDGRIVDVESDLEPSEDEVLSSVQALQPPSPTTDIGDSFMFPPPESGFGREAVDLAPPSQFQGPGLLSSAAPLAAGIETGLNTPEKMIRSGLDLVGWYPLLDTLTGSGTKYQDYNKGWMDYFTNREAQLQRENEALGQTGFVPELLQGTAQAAVELPVQLMGGVGAATPKAAVMGSSLMAGAMGGLGEYGQERQEGKGRLEAAASGATSGAITAVTTRAFGATGIESIFKKEGIAGIRNRIAETLRQMGYEGFEEAADQFQQDLLERATKNPEKPIEQTVHDVLLAGSIGTVLGGGVSATTQGVNAVRDRISGSQIEAPPRPVEPPPVPTEPVPPNPVEPPPVPTEPVPPKTAESLVAKPPGETASSELMSLSDEEAQKFFSGNQARQNSTQFDSVLAGMKMSKESIPELEKAREDAQAAAMKAAASGDNVGYMANFGKVVWINGAIEGINRSGPNFESAPKVAGNVAGVSFVRTINSPSGKNQWMFEDPATKDESGMVASFSVPEGSAPAAIQQKRDDTRARFSETATQPQNEEETQEEVLTEEPVSVGPGAASPSDLAPPVPFVTSNKNRVVDEERKARGLPPMMDLERQSNQDAWDSAMRQIDENPQVQDELISELSNQARALTPTENALLMHRRIDLRNEYEKALMRWREAFDGDDMVRAAEESARVRDWNSKLSDLEDITKATGRSSGQSLQARKMMANEDYSLAAMELRMMEAKGRSLTDEERIQLIRAQDRILELENQLADLEEGRDAAEVEKGVKETMKEVSTEAPKESKSKDFDIDREENLLSGIKAKVDKGQTNDITSLVQQLARLFWRRGVRGQAPMIDALHDALKTIISDFTRDNTQRAFSGYGNFKPLSKEEIDVGLRDLRGQTQQVLKLEALEARRPLEKTGQERRVPSDEERRLIKQVNELKRKYGVVVTDPATQLKSALAARKTYYEHRIADLKHEIETRQRIVKTKSASPRDPELDAMIAEYERLKSEHEQIFTKPEMTDEQRLKQAIAAAQRNQAHWEVRLNDAERGIFSKRTPGRKVTSAELELIQAETAAIREHVKELHELDAAVVAEKREKSLQSKKATLEKQISELERKLATGDLKSPQATPMNRPADPVLEELLQKRDELNNQIAEARKKPESQKEIEARQRELDRIHKSIQEKLDKISAGDLSTPGKKQNRPSTPEIEQAKQSLEAINKQMADMRKAAKPVKSKEEIALQSLKTRMKTQEAQLRDRIAKKDFAKKVRTPVKLDAEGLKIKATLDLAKEEFQTKLEQDRWTRMSVFQKTKRKIADVYDAARALMTTGEFSFILRQGKLAALSHPVKTAKALPDMFRALLASEKRAHEIDLQTHNDPAAEAAKQAKLYLVEEGVSLHKQEEILMGRWVGKIPIVKNFNRAAQVFLNRIRLDMWKAMRKSLTKTGTPTPEEDRQIAMFVNEATGRGGLGKLEPAAVPLARMMFSPRYYASRLQLAAGHSLWGGTMRTRRIIATEYARALVGLGLYYTALSMMFSADDDEEKGRINVDPRSSDFGKVKVGDTRVDPLAGLSQVIVLGTRTATGEKVTMGGEVVPLRGEKVKFGGDKWSDIVYRHLRGKLHPVPGSVANLFDGTDLGGDEATLINQTQNLVAPITYMDIYAALKEQDLDDGVVMALLALLGEGLQTFEEREK